MRDVSYVLFHEGGGIYCVCEKKFYKIVFPLLNVFSSFVIVCYVETLRVNFFLFISCMYSFFAPVADLCSVLILFLFNSTIICYKMKNAETCVKSSALC